MFTLKNKDKLNIYCMCEGISIRSMIINCISLITVGYIMWKFALTTALLPRLKNIFHIAQGNTEAE